MKEIKNTGNGKKLIFLDIDGTISDFCGTMPESAREAFRKVKDNGHKLCVCTGRGKGEIYPWMLQMDFDGFICGAGAYAEWQREEIYANYMEPELLEALGSLFVKNNILCIFEGTRCNYVASAQEEMSDYFMEELRKRLGREKNVLPKPRAVADWSELTEVNKLSYRNDGLQKDEFHRLLNSSLQEKYRDKLTLLDYSIAPGEPLAGEIMMQGVHKAYGMELLLKHLGMKREDTIAVGDGMNDYEMLQFAGIGVAMGNAEEELKQVADRVTAPIQEDGLYLALKNLDLF
ncbi:MAG: Cof-type HAD-IIB family hydrolase [Lachnospiraceae bacterium]|nr:Cof-type HAD-IIB family hydrolase [Lachnospiraceae bacterium]